MSQITALGSVLTQAVNSVQKDINSTASMLASGKKVLDPAQQGVVTRLGAQVAAYTIAGNNITSAQNVISVAQTGLTSIAAILTSMNNLAVQASSSGLTASDVASLQTTFTSLAGQVASLGVNSSVNGSNLLAGTAGLSVTTGIDGSASAQTPVTGVDVPALASTVAALTLSGAGAPAAVIALTTALGTVSTGQASLGASATGLGAQGGSIAALGANLQNTIDSIQNVDATKLQSQLQVFNNQQSIDYYLVSQMNTAASAVLTIFR
jgi:flagellin-like hook-associated protein FlgL